MRLVCTRVLGGLCGAVLALAGAGAPHVLAAGGGNVTCSGTAHHPGILAGNFGNVTVSGVCFAVAPVGATNVSVSPGSALVSAFDGANVTVSKNVTVWSSGFLVLGCDPVSFPCLDNSDGRAGFSIGQNLTGNGAAMELLHDGSVGMNVTQTGGGGAEDCRTSSPLGPPYYSTYETMTVGGNITISGVTTCWQGLFRTTAKTVTYDNNTDGDPDGNEIAGNTFSGFLNCSGNSPTPQAGDSMGGPNSAAAGHGQCVGIVT